GLMNDLPLSWRATAEASAGSVSHASWSFRSIPSNLSLGLFGDPSDLNMNPLGDWNTFQQQVTADPRLSSFTETLHNRFRDESLRLAGPVFNTPRGPATLTLLAEHWTEEVSAASVLDTSESDGATMTGTTPIPARSSATTSLY